MSAILNRGTLREELRNYVMNARAAVGDDEEALWRLQRGRVVVVVSDSTIMIPFLLSFCTLALAGNSSGYVLLLYCPCSV